MDTEIKLSNFRFVYNSLYISSPLLLLQMHGLYPAIHIYFMLKVKEVNLSIVKSYFSVA